MLPAVVYIGEDAELCSRLAGPLEREGYELRRASLRNAAIEDLLAGWFRVLILDADVTAPPGFDFLRRLKRHDAGVPVVVLGNGRERSLTSIGVARQNGCDGWLCRSTLDGAELAELVGDAFRRLGRWRATLEGISERADENHSRATACCD